jgi:hypothetical protein
MLGIMRIFYVVAGQEIDADITIRADFSQMRGRNAISGFSRTRARCLSGKPRCQSNSHGMNLRYGWICLRCNWRTGASGQRLRRNIPDEDKWCCGGFRHAAPMFRAVIVNGGRSVGKMDI